MARNIHRVRKRSRKLSFFPVSGMVVLLGEFIDSS
jgi:hypothetical protein